MTLIAVFNPKTPIIMSDVLLSHLALPAVRITPTGVEISSKKKLHAYQPSGFCQKTVLLHNDHVAFTGAGKVSTLKSLAVDLRDKIQKGMNREALESWMRSKQALCGNSTSVIISWCDEEGYLTGKIGNGIYSLPLGAHDTVLCGGSGVEWLKRNLIEESASIENIGEFHTLELVRALAIGQTGQHIVQERFMGLRDDFGGGFQVTYFDGNRFVPVAQVVYLTFLIEHDTSGPMRMTLSSPIVVQRWSGQRLSFELWSVDQGAFDLMDEQAKLIAKSKVRETVVPPLLRKKNESVQLGRLSTGENVNVQTLHHQAGRLIGIGSFHLMGDPKLNKLKLNGHPDGLVELSLSRDLYDIWLSRFRPMPSVETMPVVKLT